MSVVELWSWDLRGTGLMVWKVLCAWTAYVHWPCLSGTGPLCNYGTQFWSELEWVQLFCGLFHRCTVPGLGGGSWSCWGFWFFAGPTRVVVLGFVGGSGSLRVQPVEVIWAGLPWRRQ